MIGEGTKSTNQRRHTYVRDNVEVGFFTDPTVCIGCKACEVACKEWNHVPDDGFVWSGNSYDNTGHLGASTWRHVMFVEQDQQKGGQIVGSHSLVGGEGDDPFRWIFLSDVCKHCEEAGCLEACPTGSIVRTEVGSVLVQERCVQRLRILRRVLPIRRDRSSAHNLCQMPAALSNAPSATTDKRAASHRRAQKFVRLSRSCSGGSMICAHARRNVCTNCENTVTRDAQLYDPTETSVRGIHAFFLILGEPEAYGLPPKPQIPTIHLKAAWTAAFATAIGAIVATLCAFAFL